MVLLVIIFGFWLYAKLLRKADTPTRTSPTQEELAQRKIDQARRDAQLKAEHEKSECEDKISAFLMSQGFVKERLKAPSTAKFPGASEAQTEYLGECRHRVIAYVDSQNVFGAMIRTRYAATLRYVGQDKWALEGLKIQQ